MKKIHYENITSKSGTALLHINAGIIHGIKPAESWAGYLYWLFQVPPFKPKNMLMLGYGLGTIAELTRKIWGNDVSCLGIDLESLETYEQDTVIIKDAFEWIKKYELQIHDYIVVDLFEGRNVKQEVFSDEFLSNLKRILTTDGLVSIHFIGTDTMTEENKKVIEKYFKIDKVKTIDTSWILFLKHSESTIEYGIN